VRDIEEDWCYECNGPRALCDCHLFMSLDDNGNAFDVRNMPDEEKTEHSSPSATQKGEKMEPTIFTIKTEYDSINKYTSHVVMASTGNYRTAVCACERKTDATRIAAVLGVCSLWSTEAIKERGVQLRDSQTATPSVPASEER
jgi:hypothetical protein